MLSLEDNAQEVILLCLLGTMIVSTVEKYAGSKQIKSSEGTILVGTFVAGGLLLMLSYLIPDFAAGLALILFVTTILVRGEPFWDVVTVVSGGTPKDSTTTAKATNG